MLIGHIFGPERRTCLYVLLSCMRLYAGVFYTILAKIMLIAEFHTSIDNIGTIEIF